MSALETNQSKERGSVLIVTEPATQNDPKQRSKACHKSKFTTAEKLIITQEVCAAKAYTAPHGETISRFKEAAIKANANPNFTHNINAKSIQDRFLRLVEDFERRDAQNKLMSVVGGEIGELDELLGDMVEARKDLASKKKGDENPKFLRSRGCLTAAGQIPRPEGRRSGLCSSPTGTQEKRRLMTYDSYIPPGREEGT